MSLGEQVQRALREAAVARRVFDENYAAQSSQAMRRFQRVWDWLTQELSTLAVAGCDAQVYPLRDGAKYGSFSVMYRGGCVLQGGLRIESEVALQQYPRVVLSVSSPLSGNSKLFDMTGPFEIDDVPVLDWLTTELVRVLPFMTLQAVSAPVAANSQGETHADAT
jgi:hypothetical protein